MAGVFHTGDRVRVRRAYPPGHTRTPFYIRGCAGAVQRVLDCFPDPEERAYGRSGLPGRRLYRVRFRQADIWPDYSSPAGDTVDIEIYEHWLEPE